MKFPKFLKTSGNLFLDIIEVYVPSACFIILFVAFNTQIICRYFFTPLIWPEELSLMCFVWASLLGGLYAMRDGSHVAFTMVYDIFSPKKQAYIRLAANALMLIAFIIAFKPSWDYVMFMAYKKSDALRISMVIVYFPFVVFLIDLIIRMIVYIIQDARSLARGEIA
jgi:TRAP-type C4-dicarboxylate transport system permease small subunit